MKRSLVIFIVIVGSFLLGWFTHKGLSFDPDSGVQWKFVAAAERGDIREVERLLRSGARIDDVPCNEELAYTGAPALWAAADAGESVSVEWLLVHGANPNCEMALSTPLLAAEQRVTEARKTVAILKAHGAKLPFPAIEAR